MVPGLRVNTYLETPKDPHRLLWSKSGEKRGGLALGVSHRPIGRLGRSDSPLLLNGDLGYACHHVPINLYTCVRNSLNCD